jgi:hypothetical protein
VCPVLLVALCFLRLSPFLCGISLDKARECHAFVPQDNEATFAGPLLQD